MRGRVRLVPPRVPFSPSLGTITAVEGLPMMVPPSKAPLALQRPPTGPKLQSENTGDRDMTMSSKDASLMREVSSLRGKVSTASLSSLPAVPPTPTNQLELSYQHRPQSLSPKAPIKSSLVLSMWRKISSTGLRGQGKQDDCGLPSGHRGWENWRTPSQNSAV